jgi:predicted dehydrogenase
MEAYKIGIIGLGSIGTRHIKNIVTVLKKQKKPYAIDLIRSGTGKELDHNIAQNISQIFFSYDTVPADYDVLFITNPTHLHFSTIKQFASKTKHMFIEKPVFDKIDVSLDALGLKSDGIYYVACPLRYTGVIQYLKSQIKQMEVYSVRAICSSYLPDWRPGQDYRKSYSAHHDEGGGVSIDLIHEWDYLCYLFGMPQQVLNLHGKFSNLEIDSDDLSIYIAKFAGMTAEVHLDYFGRQKIREIQIFTDEDTIIGDLIRSEVRYLKSGEIISFNEQRNDFHYKEILNFFDIIEGNAPNENEILMGLKILQIAKVGN